MHKLSIIIPTFNESKTLPEVLARVFAVELTEMEKEVIVVDDCSTDNTQEVLKQLALNYPIKILRHGKNLGKGRALRSGFAQAGGDYVLVQDADLEYDPQDYKLLVKPVMEHGADVVFGSRFSANASHRVLYYWHSVGNSILTTLSNIFTNLNLTDMETCYKLIRKSFLDKIQLKQDRFGFEPEITAKLAKIKGVKFYEVGISYNGRTYEEGKHIGWRDGLKALWCIIRYNLF